MDVYTSYQDRYLGQVVHVWYGGTFEAGSSDSGASARETGPAPQTTTQHSRLRHEQGQAESPTRLIGRQIQGEDEGPCPTMDVGNSGPVNQSAEHEYATRSRDPTAGVTCFAVRPGRYNPFGRRFYIPTTAVNAVSMERIVVDVKGDGLPAAWRRHPS